VDEALTRLVAETPDVIVLDLSLQGGSAALMKELGRRGLRPRVRILLASADPDLGEKAARLGVDAYLAKPFEIPTFLAEVDRLLAV
jgi:DNA-binding response OmpR family regulator